MCTLQFAYFIPFFLFVTFAIRHPPLSCLGVAGDMIIHGETDSFSIDHGFGRTFAPFWVIKSCFLPHLAYSISFPFLS